MAKLVAIGDSLTQGFNPLRFKKLTYRIPQ